VVYKGRVRTGDTEEEEKDVFCKATRDIIRVEIVAESMGVQPPGIAVKVLI